MATGACEKYGADYGLSVTGIAGPSGGTQELPVGLIYLGYASPIGVRAKKLQLRGDRGPTGEELLLLPSTGCV